jgi:hypothetical protein
MITQVATTSISNVRGRYFDAASVLAQRLVVAASESHSSYVESNVEGGGDFTDQLKEVDVGSDLKRQAMKYG